MDVPFRQDVVDGILADLNIKHIGEATIRQAVAVSKRLEEATGQSFIHFEIGAPGIPARCTGLPEDTPMGKLALDSQIYFLPSYGRSRRICAPTISPSRFRIGIRKPPDFGLK